MPRSSRSPGGTSAKRNSPVKSSKPQWDFSTPEGRQAAADRLMHAARRNALAQPQLQMFEDIQIQVADRKAKASDFLVELRAHELCIETIKKDLFRGRPPVSWSKGFLMTPHEVLFASDITATDKLTWLAILRYQFLRKGAAFPSQSRLATDLCKSERTIRRSIQNLTRRGYLVAMQRKLTHDTAINQYLLNLEPLDNVRKKSK